MFDIKAILPLELNNVDYKSLSSLLIIILTAILVPFFVSKFASKETAFNKLTKGWYKKSLILIIGRENYILLTPLSILFSLFLWWMAYQDSSTAWITAASLSSIVSFFAILKRDWFAFISVTLLVIYFFLFISWIEYDFKSISYFTFLDPIFTQDSDIAYSQRGMKTILFIITLFMFLLNLKIVGERPHHYLSGQTSRPLTPMELEAIRKKYKKSK